MSERQDTVSRSECLTSQCHVFVMSRMELVKIRYTFTNVHSWTKINFTAVWLKVQFSCENGISKISLEAWNWGLWGKICEGYPSFFRNADEISFIFSEAVLSFFFSFVNWTHRCKTRVKVNSFGQAGCLRQAKAAPLRRSLVFREVRTNSVANAFSSKDSPNWVDHWRH